jgi:hypothetical protein
LNVIKDTDTSQDVRLNDHDITPGRYSKRLSRHSHGVSLTKETKHASYNIVGLNKSLNLYAYYDDTNQTHWH